ncbi:MAG: hypothetical protein V3T70_10220 [Phycisphaerae bacterium]
MLTRIITAFRQFHQEPADWSLETYARHTWRVLFRLWLIMVAGSLALGAATLHPARPFGEDQPFTFYTVAQYIVCSFVCGQCARRTGGGARRLWWLMCIGLAFVAADDLLRIHENLDRLIHKAFDADPFNSITDSLDNLILAVYGVIGTIVLVRQRRHVLMLWGFKRGVVWTGVLFTVMLVLDTISDMVPPIPAGVAGITEEMCKGLASCVLVWTFTAARFQLRQSPAAALKTPDDG